MATHIGIGFSQDPKTAKAAQQAARQAINQTQQAKIDLVIIFSTIHYNPLEISNIIRQNFNEAKIVGCSTGGIILKEFIAMRGVTIVAISSNEIHFGLGAVENFASDETQQAGVTLARKANIDFQKHQRKAFIFFSDGLNKKSSLLLRGLEEVFGNIFPVLGCGSSDDFHYKKTYQYYQEKVMTDSVCGFLIGGKVTLGFGSQHGWKPLGKPRIIDKVDGNIIKSIDGKPAVHIYEEYFDEEAKNLTSSKLPPLAIFYPLGIYIEDENKYLLRNALQTLDDGSIVCQGDIPEGAEVHIMIGNKDSCHRAAIEAANEVKKSFSEKQPKLILIFESLARHKVLRRNAFKEIEKIKNILGRDIPLIGIYSYGEIAPINPLKGAGKTHFQNESITIIGIG